MKYSRAFSSQLSQTFSYLTLLERQETDPTLKAPATSPTSSILSFSRRLTSPLLNGIVPRGNIYHPLLFSRIVDRSLWSLCFSLNNLEKFIPVLWLVLIRLFKINLLVFKGSHICLQLYTTYEIYNNKI